MRNEYLKKAARVLKKQKYFLEWAEDNILTISTDEQSKPFSFLVIEKDQFKGIIISFAVDYPFPYPVAEVVISLVHIAPVALGEPFYLSSNGETFWSEDASTRYMLENNTQLLNMEPTSEQRH